ncbi:MAG: patatin-like phospholipase family protein [Bacteroidales bacterium]|nr:patatin-like phospholipase family protein [Bacteroidales bacterium]
MKKALISLFAAFLYLSAGAQENNLFMPSVDAKADSIAIAKIRARMDSIRQYRPTVAVVLAGGGARGFAHIGLLRYLEELGIPVDLVGGTSMGGLVGGLYSLGYSASDLDSLVRSFDWATMMSDRVPGNATSYSRRQLSERYHLHIPFHYEKDDLLNTVKKQVAVERSMDDRMTATSEISNEIAAKIGLGMPDGILFGYNVRNTLSGVSVGYQGEQDFERLPVPYYCVASDLYSMKEKNWTEGDLVDAMRSTMAIPIYFRTVRTGGMVLVDGMCRNNFPVDVARAMGADIVIGSEMPIIRELSDLESMPALMLQTIMMLSSDAAVQARKSSDVLLQHELKGYTMLSFDAKSVNNIISQGYDEAKAHSAELGAIAAKVSGKGVPVRKKPAIDLGRTKVKVGEVIFEGLTEKEQKCLVTSSALPSDGMYDKAVVEKVLAMLYGTRAFQSVTYRMLGSEEPYTLIFDCLKGQTNEIYAGVHFDTEELAYVSMAVGLGNRKLSGLRFLGELKVGNNPTLMLEGSYKFLSRYVPTVGVALKGAYERFQMYDMGQYAKMTTVNTRADFFVEDPNLMFGKFRVGVSAEFEPYENYLSESLQWKDWDFRSRWFSAFADFRLDFTDDRYFPNKGVKARLLGRYVFGGYSTYMENEKALPGEYLQGKVSPYGVVFGSISGAISMGKHLTVLPSFYAGWYSTFSGRMNSIHQVIAGGTLEGRYFDVQMPFFGITSGFHTMMQFSAMGEVDLRYRFLRKNFVTAKAAFLQDSNTFKGMFQNILNAYAFGLSLSRQSVMGPISLNFSWCNRTRFGVFLSLGMDF